MEGNHTKDDYDWTLASLMTPALAAEYWVVKDAATQGHQTRDAAENVERHNGGGAAGRTKAGHLTR